MRVDDVNRREAEGPGGRPARQRDGDRKDDGHQLRRRRDRQNLAKYDTDGDGKFDLNEVRGIATDVLTQKAGKKAYKGVAIASFLPHPRAPRRDGGHRLRRERATKESSSEPRGLMTGLDGSAVKTEEVRSYAMSTSAHRDKHARPPRPAHRQPRRRRCGRISPAAAQRRSRWCAIKGATTRCTSSSRRAPSRTSSGERDRARHARRRRGVRGRGRGLHVAPPRAARPTAGGATTAGCSLPRRRGAPSPSLCVRPTSRCWRSIRLVRTATADSAFTRPHDERRLRDGAQRASDATRRTRRWLRASGARYTGAHATSGSFKRWRRRRS